MPSQDLPLLLPSSCFLHLPSAAVSQGIPEIPVSKEESSSCTQKLSPPRAPRASGTFHLKGETGTGEQTVQKRERTQRHGVGGRSAEPPTLPTSTPATFLPTCSRAPCFLCPDPKMPAQQHIALRHLKEPGRQTSSQNSLSPPIWGPSLSQLPGATVSHDSGGTVGTVLYVNGPLHPRGYAESVPADK